MLAVQKGSIAERAHDVVVMIAGGGAIRSGPLGGGDDIAVDRVVTAPSSGGRALFVQPKGAATVQPGGWFEFHMAPSKIPRGGLDYWAALFPLTDGCPWLGEVGWLIPGTALLKRFKGKAQGRVRVPVDPSRPHEWAKYKVARADLAARYARALRVQLPASPRPLWRALLETSRANVLETALDCHLRAGSDGLLRLWKPLTDDEGLDSGAKFVGNPTILGLQPKGVFKRDSEGLIQVHIPRATLFPNPATFLVINEFLPDRLAWGPYSWFIPTTAVADRVERAGGTLVLRVSPNPRSTKDNFLKWRHPMEDLPLAVATALTAVSRRWKRIPKTAADLHLAQRALLGPRATRAGAAAVVALQRAAVS